MRPRSAGSSRISNRLLPLLTEAAISSASPLTGTAAFVAAVTLNGAVAASAAVAEAGWGCKLADNCAPAFDESVGAVVGVATA